MELAGGRSVNNGRLDIAIKSILQEVQLIQGEKGFHLADNSNPICEYFGT